MVNTELWMQIATAEAINETTRIVLIAFLNGRKPLITVMLRINRSKIKKLRPEDSFQNKKSNRNVPIISRINVIRVCFSMIIT
jgi:hypothetical protein